MRSSGVVPEEPVHQLQVEGVHVVPQERSILSDEVLPCRPIEPLDERIHLGRAGIGVEMGKAEGGAGISEVLGKLASVVGLKLVDLEWANLNDSPEEVGG